MIRSCGNRLTGGRPRTASIVSSSVPRKITNSLREAQTLRWAWITAYKLAWERAVKDESMTSKDIEALAAEEQERLTRLEGGG